MGKTKIKTIDDSVTQNEEKKPAKKQAPKIDNGNIEDSNLQIEDGDSQKENPPSTINSQNTTLQPQPSIIKKSQKPGKAKYRSKKYQQAVKSIDRNNKYSLEEAVELVKKLSYSGFPGTLEAHINTSQTGLRGLISLPYFTGKKLKILAFGQNADKSGADLVGDDNTIEAILKSNIDFDLIVTTPEWMPKLAKAAKILGPKGLMPNPKNGTIADDLKKAVESFQAGKTEYKTESKAPVIHLNMGKLSQPNEELAANIQMLLTTLGKSRIKKVTLSPTMGPSVKVNSNQL